MTPQRSLLRRLGFKNTAKNASHPKSSTTAELDPEAEADKKRWLKKTGFKDTHCA